MTSLRSGRGNRQEDRTIALKLIFTSKLDGPANLARVVLLHGNVIRVDVTVTGRSPFIFDSVEFRHFQTERPQACSDQMGTPFVEVAAKRSQESDYSPR